MWEGMLPADTPVPIAQLVYHAERFSCAVNGAALLYNRMLAEERPGELEPSDSTSADTYSGLLDEWAARATRLRLPQWAQHHEDFWDCVLGNAVRVPGPTRDFLDTWSCGVPEVCLACELQRCTGVTGGP